MTWQTKVAAWVIPLLAEFLIPDDADVVTNVDFATLEGATDPFTSDAATFTADYPGLIPNYSLDPVITTTTEGVSYALKAKKAIGFYGVLTTIMSFDPERLNSWTFPLVRRNFGFCSLSRGDKVVLDEPMHYQRQYHLDTGIISLASNYDDEFDPKNLFNSVDKFALDRFSCFQYPGVTTRVAFLPIWEVWAVRFFRSQENDL